MAGKWHLGEDADAMPQNHGFDRSFALAASGADNWEDKSYIPYYHDAPWYEDGREAALPEDFYSSEFIVDTAIRYLEETDADAPFFAYLPFQAIHIPVQAPPEFTAPYADRFTEGWHVLQRERHARAQELGLIPESAPLAPMPEDARPWDSLSEGDRELYAARMAVNAGMLTAMDHHIGRFIDYLDAQGELENTLFVVTSDNGPEPNRGDHDWRLGIYFALTGYHTEMEGMGEAGSWGFIGPEWALAASSPGTLYKFYATEGGVRAPLVMAGPGVRPTRIDSPAMVTDVAPTLLDLTGVGARGGKPMTGRSLLPVLSGEAESAYAPDEPRAIEVSGNSALYKGDYKILRSVPPVGDGQWRLYDLSRDPGETTDLSSAQPERLADMLADYAAYEQEMGVLPMPEGYSSTEAIAANTTKRVRARHGTTVLLVLGGLVALIVALVVRRRRRRAV